jgi:hypothetical protein
LTFFALPLFLALVAFFALPRFLPDAFFSDDFSTSCARICCQPALLMIEHNSALSIA